jgi:hypothetical protein
MLKSSSLTHVPRRFPDSGSWLQDDHEAVLLLLLLLLLRMLAVVLCV